MRWRRAWARAEHVGAVGGGDRADVADAVAVEVRRDELVEVLLVVDDAGDDEAAAGPAGDSMASAVPLSGWIRPKKSRCSPGCGSTAKASTSMPWWIVAA